MLRDAGYRNRMLYLRDIKPAVGRITTDLHIYVRPIHVVWNHVDTDKLTTANGETFASNSASRSSQSR